MNERLKEIAIEAKVEHCVSHVRLQEFAELLEKEFEAKYFSAGYIQGRSDGTMETAKECADLCVDNVVDEICNGKNLSARIKKHFGIEE